MAITEAAKKAADAAKKTAEAAKKAAKALKKKKQLGQLSDVLKAAGGMASGGGGGGSGVSATSQSYGRGPVPERSPFDEEDTENAAGRR